MIKMFDHPRYIFVSLDLFLSVGFYFTEKLKVGIIEVRTHM
jgi:hypothetical protein